MSLETVTRIETPETKQNEHSKILFRRQPRAFKVPKGRFVVSRKAGVGTEFLEGNPMSKLYVRVMTGFYFHRKTAKLRRTLGTDAFWIPPRLWAYAAEHQPDGNMAAYSGEELAELLGCSKHANVMLEALKDCGFIEENGIIHDWQEHNGYHQKYSDRAKKAAAARWNKEKTPTPPKEESGNRKVESGDKQCSTDATSIELPENLKTDTFKKAWENWQQHRKEKKIKITPLAAKMQIKQCSEWGEGRAVAAIEHSIRNGYQGIYEEKKSAKMQPKQQIQERPVGGNF